MVWTSIGGVTVKGLLQLPRFFRLVFAAKKAALAMDECRSAYLLRRDRLFFAVSVWDSPTAMKTYSQSGAHARFVEEDAWIFTSTFNCVLQGETPPTRDEAVTHWTQATAARNNS